VVNIQTFASADNINFLFDMDIYYKRFNITNETMSSPSQTNHHLNFGSLISSENALIVASKKAI